MNAVENSTARKGWHDMGLKLGKPNVIIAVSAHWNTKGLHISTASENVQIYDMYGFPEKLYNVKYKPDGSPQLAEKMIKAFNGKAVADNTWGIDHGVWSVLCNMYPDADVPVVMVSTDTSASPESVYETGKVLSDFRNNGAMVIASGNIVHNLSLVNWDMKDGYAWADDFDKSVKDAILSGSFSVPVNYQSIDNYRYAVPSVDHYYPLIAALGAADRNDKITIWNEYRELGSMSMTSYLFE
jgi:4,5-DOPA dioxygenase extradiol